MNDLMLYSFIGLVIFYILYAKGVIFANFHFVTPKEVMDMITNEKKNILILDVRTDMEYKNRGHIKDAILIPVQNLNSRIDELENFKNHKILVYCASGSRSVSACRILYKHDFNPYNINGGINGWINNNYKLSN